MSQTELLKKVKRRKLTLEDKLKALDEALKPKVTEPIPIELPPELKELYEQHKAEVMNYKSWNYLEHLDEAEREQMGKRFLERMKGKSLKNIERKRYEYDLDYMPEKDSIVEKDDECWMNGYGSDDRVRMNP